MSTALAAVKAQSALAFSSGEVRPWPLASAVVIVLCDTLSLIVSASFAVLLSKWLNIPCVLSIDRHVGPVLGLFLLAYSTAGLYPGIAVGPITEIRRTTSATSLIFLLLAVPSYISLHAPSCFYFVLLAAWATVCVLVPVIRTWLRRCISSKRWWGYPVIVLGASSTAKAIACGLQSQPESGFKPVAILATDGAQGSVNGVPVVSGAGLTASFARTGVKHAIVAVAGLPHKEVVRLMNSHVNVFPHVLMIPKLDGLSSLGVETRECSRWLMLQTRNQLLSRGSTIAKRTMDLGIALIVGIAALPLTALIALLIKIESRGPVFYSHTRIGKNGTRFRAWKFRSMVVDSGRLFHEYLAQHPEAAYEWRCSQKLKNDVRITRVGRFLRKWSLDELPQMWNILRGDMSLVGPRPIVDDEILRYGDQFALYKQVIPGLTGLWQVSGRSDVPYPKRVELDTYYIRNWSPWLDIYLLARTIEVVLKGQGAC